MQKFKKKQSSFEFFLLWDKKAQSEGFYAGQRCVLEVISLALTRPCLACFSLPLLCDQYLSLHLNQRPAEVFAGCYIQDTKAHSENRAAVTTRLTAGLGANLTWVQISVAPLTNRDGDEILITRSTFFFLGLCEFDPHQKMWPNLVAVCLLHFARGPLWKIATPVLLTLVVKHWNKILCNMHNQMLV